MTQTQTIARCTNAHLPGTVADCCGLIGPKGERNYHAPPTIHNVCVGDRVRAFDFASYSAKLGTYGIDVNGDGPDRGACYYEGEVLDIIERGSHYRWEQDGQTLEYTADCDRYVIAISRRVFDGEEVASAGVHVFPPVNGTRTLRGYTFGVQPMGLDLDTARGEIEAEASRYRKADRCAERIAEEIARLTDALHAAKDEAQQALDHATNAVYLSDAMVKDEAGDLFSDLFGYYPSEVV